MAPNTMPWQVEGKGKGPDEHFKYQYHPGGDTSKAPKHAPSALNTVIVPAVNLPKVVQSRYRNGNGLADSVNSHCTKSTTSGGKMATSPVCKMGGGWGGGEKGGGFCYVHSLVAKGIAEPVAATSALERQLNGRGRLESLTRKEHKQDSLPLNNIATTSA
jgi:hypothetical protein